MVLEQGLTKSVWMANSNSQGMLDMDTASNRGEL